MITLQTLQDIETYNTIIVKSSFKVIAMVIIVTYLIFLSQILIICTHIISDKKW